MFFAFGLRVQSLPYPDRRHRVGNFGEQLWLRSLSIIKGKEDEMPYVDRLWIIGNDEVPAGTWVPERNWDRWRKRA
jgi:hypothetical protein